MGSRAIAVLVGVSRNTVKSALAKEGEPHYQRKKIENPDVEPFVQFITECYLVKHFRVSRILKELRSKGFPGSKSALYRWIEAELKDKRQAQRAKAFKPYETKPGEQCQYDWAEYRLPIGGIVRRLYIHLTLLGYSRYRIYEASLEVHQGEVFGALEESFQQLGGLTERVQVDNTKVFVQDPCSDRFRWNGKFLQFCGFYGISPSRSAPYHPWSKGKVEKPFSHLEDHFIQGAEFESVQQLLEKLKAYQEQVNSTVHTITHKTPAELFTLERQVLHSLPLDVTSGKPRRFVGLTEQVRTVSSDCLICWAGNRYSVPHQFVGSQVWVRVRRALWLEAYSQKNLMIATHRLCPSKGQVIIEKAHYSGYRKETDRDSFELSAQKLRDRFTDSYPRVEPFLQSLHAQKRLNPDYNLMRIVGIFEHYAPPDCIQAMEACFRYNCFSATFLQGLITHSAPLCDPPLGLAALELPRLRIPTPPLKRDLREYQL
jgi:transposase